MTYIYLIIAVVAGYYFGKKFAIKQNPSKPGFGEMSKDELTKLRSEAKKALGERTEERKEKILELMRNESKHREELKACGMDPSSTQITSENIEKLFDVHGDTARKYLNALEAEGKIEQVGERGAGVYYILKLHTI
ncbi:hypothetical protein ACFLZC_02345 [Patescibacteria group bacterium]